MSRRLEGSLRARSGRWYASLPNRTRPGRTEVAFPTREEAAAWLASQQPRVKAGLDPVRPRRRRAAGSPRRPASAPRPAHAPASWRSAGLPDPKELALSWHDERYEQLEAGNPDTSDQVRRSLVLHVIPLLAAVVGTEALEGRRLVVDWVRCQSGRPPKHPDAPFAPGEAYEQATVRNWLRLLREVLAYYRLLGHELPDYARGIAAMAPRTRRRKPAGFVPLEQVVRLSAHLHVIHQVALWLLRGAGLRISEAYGLLVANLVIDEKGHGYLVVEQLGGRFQIRDENGNRRHVRRKDDLKTKSAYRLVALADPLTELLLTVVEVFHTDEEGTIDLTARLIPAIRAEEGGADGFRQALTAAARALELDSDNPDDYCIHPHAMRKGFNTDLAWDHEIPALVRLRIMGHKAGSSVNDLVYTLDRRLRKDLRPAAKAVAKLMREATSSLMVPTARRPHYGTAQRERALALYDPRLHELGWQVDPRAGRIGPAEASHQLGLAESTTRRLMAQGAIAAVKGPTGWTALPDDVTAYRRTYLEGRRSLGDVARACQVSYHVAYRVTQRLELALEKDPSGALLLGEHDVAAITAACARLVALEGRSASIGTAAALLGTRHKGSIHRWVDQGLLAYDGELDAAGNPRVTKASLAVELARRGRPADPSVAEVMDASGLDAPALKALVASGQLVRVRDGWLGGPSVHAWIVGFRPDLVATPLFRRLALYAGSGLPS